MQNRKKVNLVWFRNDLRVRDNQVLTNAMKSNMPVIALYAFDPRHFEETEYGFKKTEKFRAKFLIESVKCLQQKLKDLNIGLYTSTDTPEQALHQLQQDFEIEEIFFQKEWTSEEKKVQKNIENANPSIKLNSTYNQFLFHPEEIPFEDFTQIPEVFTQFRKACEKQGKVRAELPVPHAQDSSYFIDFKVKMPSLNDLGLDNFKVDSRSAFPFEGGEKSAWERLSNYFWETKKLQYYKKTRNGLLGTDYSSKFSAWLANGSISAVSIYHQVKKFEKEIKKNQDTYWLIFELIWRDYFKYISLKHGNSIFKLGGILNKDYKWNNHEKAFQQWINGQTPENFVNANMLELKQTGFMSNRGRQNVNSYWAKEWQQDWRKGAAYFEAMLIDYDVHSNWGNWMYNSGVGNDPRDRKFNIKRQAERYDSNGTYQRTWLQENLF